jgi:branched-chain amino acid transport system ATP-binding protein
LSRAVRLLDVEDLVAGYEADAPILNGVSIAVGRGEIIAILGPNGAGKSTLVKAIAGLMPGSTGRVSLDGEDITRRPAHAMVHLGLALVPQTDNVFASLSVSDNLKIAAQALEAGLRAARFDEAFALFPDLERQRRLPAGRLSGGQRQMLAVARALISAPKLLLLDEPSAGLAPKVVADVFHKLEAIRDSGVSVVLVEQNVRAALSIADRIYVLVEGRNRAAGPPGELGADPAIAALYLGGSRPPGAAVAR